MGGLFFSVNQFSLTLFSSSSFFFCRWSRGEQRADKARPQTARVPGRSGAEPEPGQRGQRGGRAARHPARLSEPLGAGVPGAGKVDSW